MKIHAVPPSLHTVDKPRRRTAGPPLHERIADMPLHQRTADTPLHERSADAPMRLRIVDTPLGPMRLQAQGGALTGAWFLDQADCPPMPSQDTTSYGAAAVGQPRPDTRDDAATPDAILDQAALELAQYFAGQRREFSLPMAPRGTPFQRRVWDALRDIPFGRLESYGFLAQRCAHAAAVRAVAQAVGRNPISIFIPCHRIVGSNGALTGFGGGLPRKQALLGLEGHPYATASPAAKRMEDNPGQGTLW